MTGTGWGFEVWYIVCRFWKDRSELHHEAES